jgi:hypothetical protein
MARFPLLCKALEHLIDRWGPVEGRNKLMKLIYLADLEWARGHKGAGYTEARYYRWNHGPFSREVLQALEWMDGIEVVQAVLAREAGDPSCYRSGSRTRLTDVRLDPAFVEVLDRVGLQWGGRPGGDLLAHVYGRARFQDRAFGEPLLQPGGGASDDPDQE